RRRRRGRERQFATDRQLLVRTAAVSGGVMAFFVAGMLAVAAATANPTPSPGASAPAGLAPSSAPRIGSGPVTVVEFADFQCPGCAAVSPELQTLVDEGKITLVFREFPLPQHANADLAARAALAANLQGKFWPMHDRIYGMQGAWQSLPADQARAYFSRMAGDLL